MSLHVLTVNYFTIISATLELVALCSNTMLMSGVGDLNPFLSLTKEMSLQNSSAPPGKLHVIFSKFTLKSYGK